MVFIMTPCKNDMIKLWVGGRVLKSYLHSEVPAFEIIFVKLKTVQ